jgi:hypothetical protein
MTDTATMTADEASALLRATFDKLAEAGFLVAAMYGISTKEGDARENTYINGHKGHCAHVFIGAIRFALEGDHRDFFSFAIMSAWLQQHNKTPSQKVTIQ